jgi:Domain of unknown function (DUF3387)
VPRGAGRHPLTTAYPLRASVSHRHPTLLPWTRCERVVWHVVDDRFCRTAVVGGQSTVRRLHRPTANGGLGLLPSRWRSGSPSRLGRYEARQISSAEVVERLVEIAKNLREARRRHEQLGLGVEEAAFYDALAGGVEDGKADPQLAKIANELVKSIRADLTVDWAERESSEAAIRVKIKRLLRKHNYQPKTASAAGGGKGPDSLNHYTQLVLEQAKALYRYWPEVQDRLFE